MLSKVRTPILIRAIIYGPLAACIMGLYFWHVSDRKEIFRVMTPPQGLEMLTLEDKKNLLLGDLLRSSKKPPSGAPILPLTLSEFPYFLIYADVNNNNRPDTIFMVAGVTSLQLTNPRDPQFDI